MKRIRELAKKLGMKMSEDANVGVVIGFIVTAIVLAIGVVILYQVQSATPAIANTSIWYTTQSNLATTTQSGYSLLSIVLIVMAAVGILGVLFMLVGNRNQ